MNTLEFVYVVVAFGGEYDDAWENNVAARRAEEAAQLVCTELEARDKRISEARNPMAQAFHEYHQSQPLEQEELPPWPKGPVLQTKENRVAHAKIMTAYRALILPITERNQVKQNTWTAAGIEAQKLCGKNLGLSDDDMKVIDFPHLSSSDASYRVEKLELL